MDVEEALITTAGVTDVFTVIEIVFEVAVIGFAQAALEVISQ